MLLKNWAVCQCPLIVCRHFVQQTQKCFDGILVIAVLLVSRSEIKLRLQIVRIHFDERLKGLNGFRNPVQSYQRPAQKNPGGFVAGLGLNEIIQDVDGFIVFAGLK